MKIPISNTSKNKTKAKATHSAGKQGGTESTFQLVDNRAEAVVQRKLQATANSSPQVQQLAAVQQLANQADKTIQKKEQEEEEIRQHKTVAPIQKKENNTGLPDQLKSGVENLSGHSMDDVKVHYNSSKPAQLQAHAYAQGTNIHLGSGQEKHLPHEAWHVVQQKQGRVKPTMQMKGKVNINDDEGLEKEADVMGAKAIATNSNSSDIVQKKPKAKVSTVIRKYTQRMKIGKTTIETVAQLAVKLGKDKAFVIDNVKAGIPDFPVDEANLNKFLKDKKSTLHKGLIHQPEDFCRRLALLYKQKYWKMFHSETNEKLEGINKNQQGPFKTLHDNKYFEDDNVEDDGASVKDRYDDKLDCSLFAMLELKNPFLGATNRKELHNVLRMNSKTKNYDDDDVVVKLRIAGGLKLGDSKGKTKINELLDLPAVKVMGKIIIDPTGQAHTIVAKYIDNTWKRYDNDKKDGVSLALGGYGTKGFKAFWHV